MKFVISDKIFAGFPKLFVGVIVAKNIDNTKTSPEITSLLREIEKEVRAKLSLETIREHPNIATWHEAYKKFGANPKDFRPSNEALARLVLNDRELRNINPLVDLYNYLSLKYTLTLGGEDLDTMQGDLLLDYATGEEDFIPLGEAENDSPKVGEVIYKDSLGVICRRWNWREGDRTKLTESTKNTVLVAEGLPPIENSVIKKATEELAELVKKYCGGELQTHYLDKATPSISL